MVIQSNLWLHIIQFNLQSSFGCLHRSLGSSFHYLHYTHSSYIAQFFCATWWLLGTSLIDRKRSAVHLLLTFQFFPLLESYIFHFKYNCVQLLHISQFQMMSSFGCLHRSTSPQFSSLALYTQVFYNTIFCATWLPAGSALVDEQCGVLHFRFFLLGVTRIIPSSTPLVLLLRDFALHQSQYL